MTGIGLAIQASSADDHFIAAVIDSLAEQIISRGWGLFTRVVQSRAEELALYTQWSGTQSITGVILIESGPEDDRIALLQSLQLPFTALVDITQIGEFPAVATDVTSSLTTISTFFAEREKDRAVYIPSLTTSVMSPLRNETITTKFTVMTQDDAQSSAVQVASEAVNNGATILLFESDVDAAAVVSACSEQNIRIPGDVAVVSWTDSALCQSASPAITAVNRRGEEIGHLLGIRILETIEGSAPTTDLAPLPFLVRRESA